MTFYTDRRKAGYVPGRDPLVDEVMRGWQKKYCDFHDVRVCISTFNVNGRSPPEKIPDWFSEDSAADYYVVGLQEMDLSVGTYIIDNTRKMDEWLKTIHRSLPGGSNHTKIISTVRLVGIFIVLFRNSQSKIKHDDVNVHFIATGISVLGSKLGNKGGTAVSLKFNHTLVCFVNCHLAAGNGELERRNQDYRDISQLQFSNNLTILDHDVVFWFGDLNYRINTDSLSMTAEQVREKASSKDFRSLLQYDQLREQQQNGHVFVGFKEKSVLDFKPTYKYDPGKVETWDSSEKARVPAWCDRILWWCREEDMIIKQLHYTSIQSVTISDHKPVRSVFSFKVKTIKQAAADALHEEAIREADRQANELLPQISLSENELDMGEVRFLQPVSRTITVRNIGKSKVVFKFMVRPQGSASARWLQVTPPHYLIPVGQLTQISLTVSIDENIARTLVDPNLQDILVMSLENGRDHFIPVTAKYNSTVFGPSLHHLLRNKVQKSVNLIDFGDTVETGDESPALLPKEIYRLVSALNARGAESLHLDNSTVTSNDFFAVRNALEGNHPKDLTQLRVPTFVLYNTLIRLLDSLSEPVIPYSRQIDFKQNNDPGILWTLVSTLPAVNAATLEYLIVYLTELIRTKRLADDLLNSWADVLFRDRPNSQYAALISTDPRTIALKSLCAYSKDVSICHAHSTPRMAP